MRQDVANMRFAPQGGNDEESEIADGDLPMVMRYPRGGLGWLSFVFGELDRAVVDLPEEFYFLAHHDTPFKRSISYPSYWILRLTQAKSFALGE